MAPRFNYIPRNFDNLEFLQPAQCAYADDLTALALALRSVNSMNYRKCCAKYCYHSAPIQIN